MTTNPILLVQAYDEQGNQIPGQGMERSEMLAKGLPHAAVHIWIWRRSRAGVTEVLLQKRSQNVRAWPGYYDISAAGHIDLGERPLDAALRELSEEIGLEARTADLQSIGVGRQRSINPTTGGIENEFCFLYLLQMDSNAILSFQDGEVGSTEWRDVDQLEQDATSDTAGNIFVPHGELYFRNVFAHIRRVSTKK